jgi:hypothetical protein
LQAALAADAARLLAARETLTDDEFRVYAAAGTERWVREAHRLADGELHRMVRGEGPE